MICNIPLNVYELDGPLLSNGYDVRLLFNCVMNLEVRGSSPLRGMFFPTDRGYRGGNVAYAIPTPLTTTNKLKIKKFQRREVSSSMNNFVQFRLSRQ